MFAIDSLVLDLVFGAEARPTSQALIEALGGDEVARQRLVVDPDLDAPQIELEISPTVPLRRRGERRLLIVDETVAPLRKDPRRDPIVARDLRAELERLVALVEKTGARFGRMYAFGTWAEAAVVTRSLRDMRGIFLIGWALDPTMDLEGRRRATPLSQKEFEQKLLSFDKRLDELDDATILARIPPERLQRRGTLYVLSALSDRDGSWDIRTSLDLEKRIAAYELFSLIPGARRTGAEPGATGPAAGAVAPPLAPARPETGRAPEAGQRAPGPPPPAPPPEPAGPPIEAVEVDGRVVLRIPGARFHIDLTTALGRRNLDVLRKSDVIPGRLKDRIHEQGCGFVAPLEFLSEVFLEGKPLDRRTFEAQAVEASPGVRALEAHLPRFGPVRVVETGGRRYVTSETGLALDRLLPLLQGLS